MKKHHLALVLLTGVSLSACMGVGVPMGGGMSGSNQGMLDQGNAFQASMAAAQANADRPGDEAMDCTALEAELVTMMQDPVVRTHIEQAGGAAKDAQDQIDNQRAKMTGMMAASVATGLIASFVPGGGYAAMASNMAMARSMQAGTAPMQQSMMQIMSSYSEIMPQMMRGQHMMELGKAKSCAFMKDMDVPEMPPV